LFCLSWRSWEKAEGRRREGGATDPPRADSRGSHIPSFCPVRLTLSLPARGRVVRGDLAGGGVYYTDAGFLASHEKLSAWDRVSLEGELQRLMPGGGITYLWLGNERLTGEQVTTFLCRVHRERTAANWPLLPILPSAVLVGTPSVVVGKMPSMPGDGCGRYVCHHPLLQSCLLVE